LSVFKLLHPVKDFALTELRRLLTTTDCRAVQPAKIWVVGRLIWQPSIDTDCSDVRLLKGEVIVAVTEGSNVRDTVWRALQPPKRLPEIAVTMVPTVTVCRAEQPLNCVEVRDTLGLLISTEVSLVDDVALGMV